MALAEEQIEQLVLLLIVSLVVALVARQFRFPYTLALVLVGLALGRIPIVSGIHLNPDVVLFIFIPVLLFEGSWNVSVTVLLKNWLPVSIAGCAWPADLIGGGRVGPPFRRWPDLA